MKATSDTKPKTIEVLDSNTYAFNYNIVERQFIDDKENTERTVYDFDQVIIPNTFSLDEDIVIAEVINQNYDLNQQFKLINDYYAYSGKLETQEKYKTRYEDFLKFRTETRNLIQEYFRTLR